MIKKITYIKYDDLPKVGNFKKSEIFLCRMIKLSKSSLFTSLLNLEPIMYVNSDLLLDNKDLYYNTFIEPFLSERKLKIDVGDYDKMVSDLLKNAKCICSQKIKKIYLVYNKIDNSIFSVGSSCIKKWISKLETGIKKEKDKDIIKSFEDKKESFINFKRKFPCVICHKLLNPYETKNTLNPICENCFLDFYQLQNYMIKSGKYKGETIPNMFKNKQKTAYLNFLFDLKNESKLYNEHLIELVDNSLKYSLLNKKIKFRK